MMNPHAVIPPASEGTQNPHKAKPPGAEVNRANFSARSTQADANIPLIDERERFQDRVPDDFQTLWAEFVDRVLRRVMEDVAVSVVEINDVGDGNA